MWIPGGGSIETWDWVLDHDYCYLSYFGFIRGSKVLQGFWQRCDARGIEPNPYRSGFLQLVAVAETDAAAERDYYTPPTTSITNVTSSRALPMRPGTAPRKRCALVSSPGWRSSLQAAQ